MTANRHRVLGRRIVLIVLGLVLCLLALDHVVNGSHHVLHLLTKRFLESLWGVDLETRSSLENVVADVRHGLSLVEGPPDLNLDILLPTTRTFASNLSTTPLGNLPHILRSYLDCLDSERKPLVVFDLKRRVSHDYLSEGVVQI